MTFRNSFSGQCEAFHFLESGRAFASCDCDGWQLGLFTGRKLCGLRPGCRSQCDSFESLGCKPV
jgi:hypothetical protein